MTPSPPAHSSLLKSLPMVDSFIIIKNILSITRYFLLYKSNMLNLQAFVWDIFYVFIPNYLIIFYYLFHKRFVLVRSISTLNDGFCHYCNYFIQII